MATAQIQGPVLEVGYIRFKLSMAATVGTELPSISFGGGSSNLDELATTLVAQPNALTFATSLLDLCPHPSFAVTSWATFDTTVDSDWCMFRVVITLPTDAMRQRVVSQTLAVSSNITLMFGPSRAAWLAIGLRLGPQFGAFVGRIIPSLSGGSVSSGLSGWLGPMSVAIPLGIGVRDFVVAICAAARARGVQRGHWNQVGTAYVREAYGMRPPRSSSNPRASEVGRTRAQADITRHGVVAVRSYLERHFRGGRPMVEAHTQSGYFIDRDVTDLGIELGEAMFRSSER